jgi:hypothetical protein
MKTIVEMCTSNILKRVVIGVGMVMNDITEYVMYGDAKTYQHHVVSWWLGRDALSE